MTYSIFDFINDSTGLPYGVTTWTVLISLGTAVLLGLLCAVVYPLTGARYTKGFLTTLVALPVSVYCIIMLVSGNIGAALGVAGAFALIRFRSAQGSAREISSIMASMTIGLCCGLGFIFIAALVTVTVNIILIVFGRLHIAEDRTTSAHLRITIPEVLEYDHVFDDLFSEYLVRYDLIKTKTTNMGSMFELTYEVQFRRGMSQKAFIDAIRVRNGNLPITVSAPMLEKSDQL